MPLAPGGARTPDLRITWAPSAPNAFTAYKYDALTDCATGAWVGGKGVVYIIITRFPRPELKNLRKTGT